MIQREMKGLQVIGKKGKIFSSSSRIGVHSYYILGPKSRAFFLESIDMLFPILNLSFVGKSGRYMFSTPKALISPEKKPQFPLNFITMNISSEYTNIPYIAYQSIQQNELYLLSSRRKNIGFWVWWIYGKILF